MHRIREKTITIGDRSITTKEYDKPVIFHVVNVYNWSWGLASNTLIQHLPDYTFLTDARKPGYQVSGDFVQYCDLTLLQNMDTIKLISDNRRKVIVRMGGMLIDNNNENLKDDRYDEDLAACGAIIATNQELFNVAKRVNPNTILCPNGVDLEKFKPADPKIKNKTFTVGFAGNIWGDGIRYKGYKHFMQAVIKLYGQIKTETCLHMHSQIPHDEMPQRFYHHLDCLVLPSAGEGCSNVTVEALACGIPVLTTRVGYHGEVLLDNFTCLFIERNEQSIISAILKLKGDKDLQNKLSINGRKFAEEHHDIKKIAKVYDNVFKKILSEREN